MVRVIASRSSLAPPARAGVAKQSPRRLRTVPQVWAEIVLVLREPAGRFT